MVRRWFLATWRDLRAELSASLPELTPGGRFLIRLFLPLLVPLYFLARFVEDLLGGPDTGGLF